jgi:hypothetical protein
VEPSSKTEIFSIGDFCDLILFITSKIVEELLAVGI